MRSMTKALLAVILAQGAAVWIITPTGNARAAEPVTSSQAIPPPPTTAADGHQADKLEALARLREQHAKAPFHPWKRRCEPFEECRKLLTESGVFADLAAAEGEIVRQKLAQMRNDTASVFIENVTTKAFMRIWQLSESFRNGAGDSTLKPLVYRAIAHYGRLENDRINDWFRFHASCFAIPTAAINSYFCFFPDMQDVELGTLTDPLSREANAALRAVAFQAWSTPLGREPTQKQIVSVNRFRGDGAFTGANGLSYRPAFQAAVTLNSVPMMDVIAEVTKGSLSVVSQTTFKDAFWIEGMTADGAGWGHGRQSLVFSYPMEGCEASLAILGGLKGTPWAEKLDRRQIDALLNYLRGSAFYEYKGHVPRVLGRDNMIRPATDKPTFKVASGLADQLLKNWSSDLTEAERDELKEYLREAADHRLFMTSKPAGLYHGSRYFFNNDDMIRKTPDYYVMVNMASRRVDGLESSWPAAAGFNFFTNDGVTLLQRRGNEYAEAIGAFTLTAWPGITARQTPTPLVPIRHWRGYCSKYPFAAGATSGKDFAAGFNFRKIDAGAKDDSKRSASHDNDPNPAIFDVQAFKSWFMFGDTLLALGTGISNLKPQLPGEIWTTLDQTSLADDGKSVRANGLEWQVNNGFSYAVLPDHTTGVPVVKRESRTSAWKSLCQANQGDEHPVGIFEMAINHGQHVKEGTYAYVVNCLGSPEQPLPMILSNTRQLQAAANAAGSVVGGIFFEKAAALETSSGRFTVSAPCALLVEYHTDREQTTITVTDAMMNPRLAEIVVSTPFADQAAITIPLPAEPFRGRPASVTIPGRRRPFHVAVPASPEKGL